MSDEQTVACYEVSSAGIQKVRVSRSGFRRSVRLFFSLGNARIHFALKHRPQKPRVKFVKQM